MPSETDKSFVEQMLKSSKEKAKDPKSQFMSEGVNKDDIARITENIQQILQKKKE